MNEPTLAPRRLCSVEVLFAGLVSAGMVACGSGASAPPPAVALVVRGDPAPRVEAAAGRTELGVDLRISRPPVGDSAALGADLSPSSTEVEGRIATARADYVTGELSRIRTCAERLGDPTLVWASLGRGSRSTAARALVWRIACASIARRDAAEEAAKLFAGLGLELPPEVEAIPVEAHKILTAALQDAAASPKRELAVRVTGAGRPLSGAQVTVDGRAACTSDCVMTVSPGDHFVQVDGDRWRSASRVVRVDATNQRTETTLALSPAEPALAGAQWARRYGASRDSAESNESVALLAQSLRARTIILLDADALGTGVRVRGALAVDGRVESRAEQHGEVESTSSDVLRELLVKGGVVENKSVFKKPLFWVVVGAVAVASSALTAYIVYDPGSRTEVRTR